MGKRKTVQFAVSVGSAFNWTSCIQVKDV